MLENSIAKICGLLAVGFGEAGSAVIAENMKRGGEINPMIPGKKVGWCSLTPGLNTAEPRSVSALEAKP